MLLSTLLLAFAVFAFASYEQPILGLSLGKRDLIVVQSLANGSTSLIARVSANTTYTNWFEQVIKLPEHERSTVDATALQEALLAAQYAATVVLQQQTQFSVVALPQELEDLVPEVLSTLGLLAPLETYASYTIRPERAIVYAYGLGTCEAANLLKGCDPDDINGEALWLDFDASLLNLRLLSFVESGGDIFAESIFSGLGRVDHLETTDERIINAIQKHFSDFLDQNTVLKDFLGRRGPKFKPLRSDIKAIVTTGDPPPGSMEAIRLAIHRISPDLANLIRDSVDPTTTPAATQAIPYAITETRLRASIGSDEPLSINLWLPNLTRIVDLCASALAAYAERRKVIKDRHTMPEPIVVEAPSPESYYLVRRCVLAFEFPELRDALYEQVSKTSQHRLAEACDLHHFLNRQSSMKETIRQGVLFRMRFYKPASEDFSEDDLELHEDGWNYAKDVLGTADWITYHPDTAHELLASIQGYVTNNMDDPEMPQPWPDFSQVRLLAEARKRDDEQPWRRNL
ncbi:hypothetical protein KCU73_g9111, partial [Aureobasidium melanogenum]